MRRSISVFLILVLMLQLTWAASARYCDHEYVSGTAHYGHHIHEHLGQSTGSAPGNITQYSAGDIDCGTCHLGFGTAFVALLSVPLVALKETFGLGAMHRTLSATTSVPYRPNWSSLA
jgi:hypothetical protein